VILKVFCSNNFTEISVQMLDRIGVHMLIKEGYYNEDFSF
jgi:hypothetical protein